MSKETKEAKNFIKQCKNQSQTECEPIEFAATAPQIPVFIKALKSKSPIVRGAAATVLGRAQGMSAAAPLIALLGDADAWVKKRVIDALGQIKAADAALPLLQIVQTDADTAIIGSALRALYAINDMTVIHELESYLKRKYFGTYSTRRNPSIAVFKALIQLEDARVDDYLIRTLPRIGGDRRKEIAQILADRGDAKWQEIIDGSDNDYIKLGETRDERFLDYFVEKYHKFKHETNNQNIKNQFEAVVEVLIQYKNNDRIRGLLVADLEQAPKTVRIKNRIHCEDLLYDALRKVDYDAFERTVIKMSNVSRDAERALQYVELRNDCDFLIGLLSKKYPNKPMVIEKLAEYQCEKAVAPISEFLFSMDGAERKAAAQALDALGEPQWAKMIQGVTDDFIALSETGDLRAAKALQQLVTSPNINLERKRKYAKVLITMARKTKNKNVLKSDSKMDLRKLITTPHTDEIKQQSQHEDVAEASLCKHGIGHGDHISYSSAKHTDWGLGIDIDDF